MVFDQERLYPDIMSHVRLGKYVWAWLVNENDWARRLDHYTVGFSLAGPVGWRVWAKAHGTHNVPFSQLGRSSFPGREKRMFETCLMWGLVDR